MKRWRVLLWLTVPLVSASAAVTWYTGREDSSPAEAVFTRAESLRSAGNVSQALDLLKGALDRHPALRGRLHERLGALYQAQGEFEQAAFHLERALRAQGDGSEVARRLIDVRLVLGQNAYALDIIERMEGDPNDAHLRHARRIAAAGHESAQDQIPIYRDLTGTIPDNRVPWVRLARLEKDAGRWHEALEVLEQALNHFPDDPEFLRMAGEAAYMRGDYQRSAQLLGQAVARHRGAGVSPDSVDLARAMVFQGDIQAANLLLDAFLAEQQHHAGAQFFRALGALWTADYKTAYRLAGQLASQYPRWNEANLIAGAAALGLQDIRSSESYLLVFANEAPERHKGARLLTAIRELQQARKAWEEKQAESGQAGKVGEKGPSERTEEGSEKDKELPPTLDMAAVVPLIQGVLR